MQYAHMLSFAHDVYKSNTWKATISQDTPHTARAIICELLSTPAVGVVLGGPLLLWHNYRKSTLPTIRDATLDPVNIFCGGY